MKQKAVLPILIYLAAFAMAYPAFGLPASGATASAIRQGIPKSSVENVTYNGHPLRDTPFRTMFSFTGRVFNQNYTARCTGVLIQERFLLFAAHCLERMNNIVVEFATNEQGTGIETIRGMSWYEHEEAKPDGHYNYKTSDYRENRMQDLAVVLLERKPLWAQPVNFLKDNSAKLAEYATYTRLIGANRRANFEITENLAKVDFVKMERTSNTSNYYVYLASGNQGICMGDSGGPSVITVKNLHYLVGITAGFMGSAFQKNPNSYIEDSEGNKTYRCSQKAIILHTGFHMEWIQKAMEKLASMSEAETPTELKGYTLQ